MKARYVRLYSDEKGESHFSDECVEVSLTNFSPPASPVYLSALAPASHLAFIRTPPHWVGEWHPVPQRQFVIFLIGFVDIRSSDGEERHFAPGAVLLLEDTSGKGHYTESDSAMVAVVGLPENADLFA